MFRVISLRRLLSLGGYVALGLLLAAVLAMASGALTAFALRRRKPLA